MSAFSKAIPTGRLLPAASTTPNRCRLTPLPDNQTVSTFKSRSSKGGGAANFNEIRFEDKKGSEQIFINAEQDMDQRVEVDSREFIGSNRHLNVGADQTENSSAATSISTSPATMFVISIDSRLLRGNDYHIKVVNDLLANVANDVHLSIGQDCTEEILQKVSRTISGNRFEAVGGKIDLYIGQNRTEQVRSEPVTGDPGEQVTPSDPELRATISQNLSARA